MLNNENKNDQSLSPKIKQVLDACNAIYDHCLQNDIGFQAYKHFRIEDIKAKRIELGYEAGSNTTIIKGKKIWLEQNEHRLANPARETKKEDDPMFGLVQKIRADLEHEADEKIAQAEQSWNDEKESLVLEAENLSEQLEKLSAEQQTTQDELKAAREQIENLKLKCDKQFLELNFSKGDQDRLQKVNDSLQLKLDDLYIKYDRELNARELAFNKLINEADSKGEARQKQYQEQSRELKNLFDAEKKSFINQIRDKDEQLMQKAVEIENLTLSKSRLEHESRANAENIKQVNQENKNLLLSQAKLEGEVSALKDVINELKPELIASKRDNATLEAQIKSLQTQLADMACND